MPAAPLPNKQIRSFLKGSDMKKLVILLFICLFLAGCVTTGNAWYHAYGKPYFGEKE